jgi:c-di-GMP-binding flagellar brake protein YcgR
MLNQWSLAMSQAWEVINRNRRSSYRYPVRLPTSLSLADETRGLGHSHRPPVIPGETSDISLDGVALIVPSLRTDRHDLTQLEHLWRIVMGLPGGYVQIVARLVRFQRVRGDDERTGYLIGVRIEEISEGDKALLKEYVQTLEHPAAEPSG